MAGLKLCTLSPNTAQVMKVLPRVSHLEPHDVIEQMFCTDKANFDHPVKVLYNFSIVWLLGFFLPLPLISNVWGVDFKTMQPIIQTATTVRALFLCHHCKLLTWPLFILERLFPFRTLAACLLLAQSPLLGTPYQEWGQIWLLMLR